MESLAAFSGTRRTALCLLGLLSGTLCLSGESASRSDPLAWPAAGCEQRPWTYWWWMASAVDRTNIARELHAFADAGFGGVHIIPIYGAKGWENKYIDYLSPEWMEMLRFTVQEASRAGLGVDMTTGSGWCFGGPRVADSDANAVAVVEAVPLMASARPQKQFRHEAVQALVAYSPEEKTVDLLARLSPEGLVQWEPEGTGWTLYSVAQRPSGQKVKRASPGAQGHMLNLIHPPAVTNYLRWFDEAFASYSGPKPRAMYHDSYEYRSDWAPGFLKAFAARRGYRLESELPAAFGTNSTDRAARVRSDYRETVSDVMIELSLPAWTAWARKLGCQTRNEAHGSPGNWLDLYATADIPETEMFHTDRNRLISKFASSAAHTAGKPRVSSETGTWLAEHWTETLADMKFLLDDLFLSGVNHIVYHGSCYSPAEAEWPGWLFYASFQMNSRNSIWRDVPALNAYATRCQSVLQAGRPDSDLLIYWPIHDLWHNPTGGVRNLSVHTRDWFEGQPIGRAATRLWERGFSFDYVSDRQLGGARAQDGEILLPGGRYRAVLVPSARRVPVGTMGRLLMLAERGATVVFEDAVPSDVPGWGNLELRRKKMELLVAPLARRGHAFGSTRMVRHGRGRVFIGPVEACLESASLTRERLFDEAGLMCIRRRMDRERVYFIANRSTNSPFDGWLELGLPGSRRPPAAAVLMDPMTGTTGWAALRKSRRPGAPSGAAEVLLSLNPGSSLFVRCVNGAPRSADRIQFAWPQAQVTGAPYPLEGSWRLDFIEGGPALPKPAEISKLESWTGFDDADARRFAGTVRYQLRFDAPQGATGDAWLDLGDVRQSARVRLNGIDLGTVFTPPFRVRVAGLKATGNILEIEVTNVAANRIRDLDRRKIAWKTFHDINFVNINYRPFDASDWPLRDSGLLGPVTLVPLAPARPK